jgi:hypothetical protein
MHVQGYKRSAVTITGPLQQSMMALKLQAEQVMAGIVTSLSHAVVFIPEHLTAALRGVFTEASTTLTWHECPDATGCWVSESEGDIFTLNLLTGAAMCNGHAPSHLPETIVGHEVYQKVFQSVVFDVTPKVDGDVVTYRTSHAINGCTYTWRKNGDRLIVTENCGDETLELLPCAPDLAGHLFAACLLGVCGSGMAGDSVNNLKAENRAQGRS